MALAKERVPQGIASCMTITSAQNCGILPSTLEVSCMQRNSSLWKWAGWKGTPHCGSEVPYKGTLHCGSEVPSKGTLHCGSEVPYKGTLHCGSEVPSKGTLHCGSEVPCKLEQGLEMYEVAKKVVWRSWKNVQNLTQQEPSEGYKFLKWPDKWQAPQRCDSAIWIRWHAIM